MVSWRQPLMAADRVGVAEGILCDLTHGRVPNVFANAGGMRNGNTAERA